MDELVQKTFDLLASGEDAGDLKGLGRKLLYGCFDAGADPDPERRLAALRVAANLTPSDRIRVIDALIRDTDPRVRRYAFNLAVACEMQGIEALRTAVNADDTDLAVDALSLIVRQLDQPSSMHARSWLRHSDPRVRAGAAMLLGNIAGPAMAVHLGRIAEADPIASVRQIAAEAVSRCTGEEPKLQPQNFWEAGGVDLEIDLTPVGQVRTVAPEDAPPPPIRASQNLSTIYPELDEDEVSEELEAPQNTLVPQAEAGAEEVRDATPRDWREPAAMPTELPSEPVALVKLYGMVRVEDQPTVLAAFQGTDAGEQARALSGWSPGADATAGRGIALVIKALGSKTHASMLRVMLRESEAGVRAGAAEAIGATGTLSMIPQLSQLLGDSDSDVRVAAVRALGELLGRMERYAMLKDRLAPMASDSDASVKAAAEEVLAAIP